MYKLWRSLEEHPLSVCARTSVLSVCMFVVYVCVCILCVYVFYVCISPHYEGLKAGCT